MRNLRATWKWGPGILIVLLWIASQYGIIQLSAIAFGGQALALVAGSFIVTLELPNSPHVAQPEYYAATLADFVFDGFNSRYLEENDMEPSVFDRVFGGFQFRTIAGDPFSGPSIVIRIPIFLILVTWISTCYLFRRKLD